MKNGMIRHIYCHSDGYPEGVGATLLQHYNTWEKVKELIDGGDISVLGDETGKQHSYDKWWHNEEQGTPAQNWTLFYKRDRGEKDADAQVSRHEESYADKAENLDAVYAYLFDPAPTSNSWTVMDLKNMEKGWVELERVLGKGTMHDKDFEDVHGEGIPFDVDDLEEVHGEGNPYESKNKIKGKLDLQEAQMAQNNDTALKIQREAKKTALRLYKTIYDNLFLASQALLEMPKEYIDGETFGPSGPFKQVYDKVKSSLDSMTSVNAPDSMTPEEVMPEPEPTEAPTEVPMGGEGDLEEVNIQ
jgi:hypothetical protein